MPIQIGEANAGSPVEAAKTEVARPGWPLWAGLGLGAAVPLAVGVALGLATGVAVAIGVALAEGTGVP